MNEKSIQDYIEFVQGCIQRFSSIGDLVQDNEVTPSKVNYALAHYYDTCLALNGEYQRYKIKRVHLELEYDALYADWFAEAKQQLKEENASKSAKPALKEIEQLIKVSHREEYYLWQKRLADAEAKCDFMLRMRETLNKFDNILTNIATSLRSELRALGIENRANARQQFNPKRLNEGMEDED